MLPQRVVDGAPAAATGSDPVPAETLANRPQLLSTLRELEQTLWPRLCKTKSVGEIGGLRAAAAPFGGRGSLASRCAPTPNA